MLLLWALNRMCDSKNTFVLIGGIIIHHHAYFAHASWSAAVKLLPCECSTALYSAAYPHSSCLAAADAALVTITPLGSEDCRMLFNKVIHIVHYCHVCVKVFIMSEINTLMGSYECSVLKYNQYPKFIHKCIFYRTVLYDFPRSPDKNKWQLINP